MTEARGEAITDRWRNVASPQEVTIKVDRPQLSPADIKRLRDAIMEKAKSD